ncbi:MAG TPA: LytTR family DNA-binding domain-containing protein [Candidatus Parabacteroides intestinipullorum]|uniref:LytTR family DNA-binding domain-containing protein n=1 Tax=Candidatus Parabacteroides intestinipullorum TaxID=2838723 RepID=A0A9D1X9X0_9BACT|nr:LytTR family DNA-binding domain-containing protein [Candidatus Parabacteroides intestinipullorum]
MNVLIVEDETTAYENMVDLLALVDPNIHVVGNTESIRQTIKWLGEHEAPDLIFMDIHLSDGSAFVIFDEIRIEIPIIFTTAYDRYAIEAFKVNSIDYLLKPVKEDDMRRALTKFSKWGRPDISQYLSQIAQMVSKPNYSDKILIPYKDKLLPVSLSEIACFYTTDKNTFVFLKNGMKYPYGKTLDQIYSTLNPHDFFRANKQFIVARNSVSNITIWFDNRLLVSLEVDTPERIYVSKNRASEFKAWMVS